MIMNKLSKTLMKQGKLITHDFHFSDPVREMSIGLFDNDSDEEEELTDLFNSQYFNEV
jgi:hypothetical protein